MVKPYQACKIGISLIDIISIGWISSDLCVRAWSVRKKMFRLWLHIITDHLNLFVLAYGVQGRYIHKFDLQDLERLKGIYKDFSAIDLIMGAIAERPKHGATVGFTFACIIGMYRLLSQYLNGSINAINSF